nr:hypothetical protein [Anaerolineales bacterium]
MRHKGVSRVGKSMPNAEATQPTQTGQGAVTQPNPAVSVGPTRSRSSLRNWMVLITILLLFLGIAAVILVPLAIYGYYQFYGLIIPGIHIGGLDLSGLSWQEAYEGLAVIYGQDPTLKITDGERTWEIPASHFGLGWNVEATTQLALNFGHGKDFQAETSEMVEGFLYGYEIEPVFTFDSDAALVAMEGLGSSVDFPPVDADLRIEGGEVVISPAASGILLNSEASFARLAENPLGVYQSGSLLLVLDPVEPAISDVSAAAMEAKRLLGTEITLHGYDPVLDQSVEWVVDKETIASWIVVERTDSEILISIDEGAIASYVQGMDETLGPDKYVDPTVAF